MKIIFKRTCEYENIEKTYFKMWTRNNGTTGRWAEHPTSERGVMKQDFKRIRKEMSESVK